MNNEVVCSFFWSWSSKIVDTFKFKFLHNILTFKYGKGRGEGFRSFDIADTLFILKLKEKEDIRHITSKPYCSTTILPLVHEKLGNIGILCTDQVLWTRDFFLFDNVLIVECLSESETWIWGTTVALEVTASTLTIWCWICCGYYGTLIFQVLMDQHYCWVTVISTWQLTYLGSIKSTMAATCMGTKTNFFFFWRASCNTSS